MGPYDILYTIICYSNKFDRKIGMYVYKYWYFRAIIVSDYEFLIYNIDQFIFVYIKV